MLKPARVCILGGGFGGLYAALKLNSYRWSSRPQFILVDKEEHFFFTPLAYELISGEVERWEIAPSFEKLLRHKAIEFKQATVEGVDLDRRLVTLAGGDVLEYDRLVIAVGGYTPTNIVSGATANAIPFRSLQDLELLIAKIEKLKLSSEKINIAIAGGGPNGVELACKLADRLSNAARISLIDRGDRVLKKFPIACQRAAIKALTKRGVELHLKTNILSVRAEDIRLQTPEKIETLAANLTVWAIGTKTYDWVRDLPCQHSSKGKLKTLPTLQLIDYPEVFVLGDTAAVSDRRNSKVPATAQAAFQQAPIAAKNIRASLLEKPLKKFRYLRLGEMITLGKNEGIISAFGINITGAIASFLRKTVYFQRMPTNSHRFQVTKHRLLGCIQTLKKIKN